MATSLHFVECGRVIIFNLRSVVNFGRIYSITYTGVGP